MPETVERALRDYQVEAIESLPTKRSAAKAAGIPRYFTGKPCKNGHVAERHTLDGSCVECGRAATARYDEKNRDLINSKRRERYAADPQKDYERFKRWASKNREHIRLKAKERRQKNRDVINAKIRERRVAKRDIIRAQHRRWYHDHKDKKNAWAKRWRENNPTALRAIRQRRKALVRNAVGTHTGKDIERILKAQKGKCANCNIKLSDYHIDHIIPLSKGGSNYAFNIQILCPKCNLSKRAKDSIAWAQENGRLL